MDYRPTYTLIAGDDKTIIIPVRDANNNSVNVSDYEDIVVTLSFKNTIFYTYRVNVLPTEINTGYVYTTTGLFSEVMIDITNQVSRNFVTGYYDVNITLFNTDILGTKKLSYTHPKYIFIENGVNKNID